MNLLQIGLRYCSRQTVIDVGKPSPRWNFFFHNYEKLTNNPGVSGIENLKPVKKNYNFITTPAPTGW